jgi:hypothetical protein
MDTGMAGARTPVMGAEPWELLEPELEWNDLVLADTELETLRAIAVGVSRPHSAVALNGGDDPSAEESSPGLRLLFAGDAGTGKTTAARGLGGELNRPVLRVEIAELLPEDREEAQRLVRQLFIVADQTNAIPFLVASPRALGQRRRVMRPHERRIAFEVSGLFEHVEQYPGLIIFASSHARRPDEVPADEFDFEIEFAIPEAAGRRRIWNSLLPVDASLTESDVSYLASSFELAGGAIRDCCSDASPRARRAHRPVGLIDITRALEQHYGPVPEQRTREALAQLRAVTTTEPARPGSRRSAARIRPRAAEAPPGPDSVRRRTQPAAESRRRSVALVLGATLAAAALGFAVAQSTGGSPSSSPPHRQSAALPRPSASYAAALNTVITKLNTASASASVTLRNARSGQEQAKAEATLAGAHSAAATALQRTSAGDVARSANANLATALSMMGDAYRVLERSAANGDAPGYQRGEASMRRAAAALNAAFAALQRLGYSVS